MLSTSCRRVQAGTLYCMVLGVYFFKMFPPKVPVPVRRLHVHVPRPRESIGSAVFAQLVLQLLDSF